MILSIVTGHTTGTLFVIKVCMPRHKRFSFWGDGEEKYFYSKIRLKKLVNKQLLFFN